VKNLPNKFNLRFDRSEISGSMGDIGTFLPLDGDHHFSQVVTTDQNGGFESWEKD
jgi:hypothetical protein